MTPCKTTARRGKVTCSRKTDCSGIFYHRNVIITLTRQLDQMCVMRKQDCLPAIANAGVQLKSCHGTCVIKGIHDVVENHRKRTGLAGKALTGIVCTKLYCLDDGLIGRCRPERLISLSGTSSSSGLRWGERTRRVGFLSRLIKVPAIVKRYCAICKENTIIPVSLQWFSSNCNESTFKKSL